MFQIKELIFGLKLKILKHIVELLLIFYYFILFKFIKNKTYNIKFYLIKKCKIIN